MSKLYDRYLCLKKENSDKLYLFKSGIFYLFLADDAIKTAGILGLKLTNLNEFISKCGFPVNTLPKYLAILKNLNYDVELIDSVNSVPLPPSQYVLNDNLKHFIHELSIIDTNSLSVKQAYELLTTICQKANKMEKEM